MPDTPEPEVEIVVKLPANIARLVERQAARKGISVEAHASSLVADWFDPPRRPPWVRWSRTPDAKAWVTDRFSELSRRRESLSPLNRGR